MKLSYSYSALNNFTNSQLLSFIQSKTLETSSALNAGYILKGRLDLQDHLPKAPKKPESLSNKVVGA